MATIDLKTRDKLKPTMRNMEVGDILRVPFKYKTKYGLTVTASQLKKETGQVYTVKSEGQVIYQLVTRIK
ncbi:MAG: hypothetical protein K2G09_06790 [Paramuribaculum sp.]|nr:hypothetical protein [Paramuribaculum sp.]